MPSDEVVVVPDHGDDMVAQQIYHLRQVGIDWLEIQTYLVEHDYVDTAPPVDTLRNMLRSFTKSMATYVGSEDRQMILGLELARLDRLQSAMWPSAMAGDAKSVAAVLRVMDQRQKLVGLDQLSTEDKRTLNTVLVVGGDQQSFVEALRAGRAQRELMAGSSEDDEDDLEGD